MSGDLGVAEKALRTACPRLRAGAPPDAIGGIVPSFVASPASTAEASALLRAAAARDLAVVPRGSGSRLGWGTPPVRCDLVVDMLGMGRVIEHAAGDLVVRVQAGARAGEVAGVLAAAGQEIALDIPGTATIGGIVADGLAGPRRLRYGSPRDLLIGITVVRADGTVAHSGGKVVKNVAGYDLGKLFAGSAGTLGLIAEATFRLHPLPASRAWVTAAFPADAVAAAAAAVAAAANSPLVASAVELDRPEPGGPVRVGALLEGSAEGVARRAAQLAALLRAHAREFAGGQAGAGANGTRGHGGAAGPAGISPEAPQWWPGAPSPDDGTLIRVSFWVSKLGHVLDAIDAAAREGGTRPAVRGSAGAGLLYLTLPAGTAPAAVAGLVSAVRGAIDPGRGALAVLAAPEAVRESVASAGGLAGGVPALALMRAVKDRFDPARRMAPGRFPEGI